MPEVRVRLRNHRDEYCPCNICGKLVLNKEGICKDHLKRCQAYRFEGGRCKNEFQSRSTKTRYCEEHRSKSKKKTNEFIEAGL